MATHVFGLTGGIASGKSTVAARLRRRGVPIIDADQLAREVVEPGTEGFRAVVDAFGTGVVGPTGHLDRKALARIVFTDDAKRKKLNAITHPLIGQLFAKRVADFMAAGEPLVCWEAALLVENGVHEMFRPLVVVAAPEEVQLARVRSRDGAAQEDALGRIRAQKPLAEKVAVADFVIDTTGSVEDNARQTDAVLAKICERFGVDPLRYPL